MKKVIIGLSLLFLLSVSIACDKVISAAAVPLPDGQPPAIIVPAPTQAPLPPAPSRPEGLIEVNPLVTINGLEKGDVAKLTITHEGASATDFPIFEKSVQSDGNMPLVLQVSADLKDGNYQLVLDATDKYFREPKGYLFQVRNSKIVNPKDAPITFNLVPPSARNYEPYRGPMTVANPLAEVPPPTIPKPGEVRYVAECFINISGEFRHGPALVP